MTQKIVCIKGRCFDMERLDCEHEYDDMMDLLECEVSKGKWAE